MWNVKYEMWNLKKFQKDVNIKNRHLLAPAEDHSQKESAVP
jgi:hypothetical protein